MIDPTRPDRHLEILQHALGVDRFGRGQMYRNHFVTGEGSIDHPDCMALVDIGHMVRGKASPLTGGDDVFFVTEQGKAHVLAASPKPDRKQRAKDRYSRFLDLCDVMPDLTFRQFLLIGKAARP